MDGIGDGIAGLVIGGAFSAVLAIAAVIAVGMSWLGYPVAALWITGAGFVGGFAAARYVWSKC